MDSCRRRAGQARKPVRRAGRAWLFDASHDRASQPRDRRSPQGRGGRPQLRRRQGALSRSRAGRRPGAPARRPHRRRAEGRRTGDHEGQKHVGGRGIGQARRGRRDLGVPHSGQRDSEVMSNQNPSEAQKTDSMSERASRDTLALNPLVAFRGKDLLDSAGTFFKGMINEPLVAADEWLSFIGELTGIASGKSERAPQSGDKRFGDPAWKTSPLHSRLLKAYLAWGEALDDFVGKTSLSDADKERAHLFTTILVDALAPTNSLLANPAAAKRLIETGGQSLLSGLSNYLDDLIKNGGLPSQVDMSAFKVGENLATTPGGVVFRNDLIELIQYEPTTAAVAKRPLVITPPQINKFYALDLSPEKSLIRFLLKNGIQIFAVSWRNPTVQHRDWGLGTYVAALDEAVDAARRISGSEDVTMMGSCSGGITACAYASTLGLDKIKNLVLAVCLLDTKTADDSAFGSLITPETMLAAKEASRLRGVLDGQDLARMFAWMRPNDLIWNYWVNNYLLGNAPPAFDILFWNADTTRLPARLHGD